ncbi:MAG: T9SS type A sorting domain-containing protein [Bacteroidota bacterium]|nr:T9SS type A sorting domain-containing protein [Bacteroidota bacterium]
MKKMNCYLVVLFAVFACVNNAWAFGDDKNKAAFTEIESAIKNFYYPSVDWGDYDGDGDLDIVLAGALDTDGDYSADKSTIKIYNNKNGVFTEIETNEILGLHLGAVRFVDIDNDGDQDLITTGQNYNDITTYYLSIYENRENEFVLKQELPGVIYSSVDIGDYNNDGFLDLLVTGAASPHKGSQLTKIYKNLNGEFTEIDTYLQGVQNGNAKFGDFDLDGDLDVVLMGTDKKDNYLLNVYFNDEGVFNRTQELSGMYLGWIALGDYDSDGDLDFAVMGDDVDDNYACRIYTNENGSFEEYVTLTGLDNSCGTTPIAWGDYDNDGDLDLVMSGSDENYDDVTILYRNDDNSFIQVDEGLRNLGGCASLAWADYDNDNDLDILISGFAMDGNSNYSNTTLLHENQISTKNLKPNAPTNLFSEKETDNSVAFYWSKATDDHTCSDGLRYFLCVGSTENSCDIASYEVCGNSWKIVNMPSNFYWSVQAIDASNVKSDKSYALSTGVCEPENSSNEILVVYPNPLKSDILYVEVNFSEIELVSILNITGEVVKSFESPNSNIFKVNDLLTGMYIVKVITKDERVLMQKIVKQ